jgi:predicted TIM-barrel fold metal-dependent hydrolase
MLPPLSCDCHVHVVGAQSQYPMIAERQYTAPIASIDDLRAHMDRLGLQRAVIIQPSFYGSDNRCLIDSLKQLNGAGRGVAVLDRAIADTQLQALSLAGVRGIRINVESSHGRDAQSLKSELRFWSNRLAPHGWHIQLFAAQGLIQQSASTIKSLEVDLVLDHFSLINADAADNDLGLVSTVDLLKSGKVWLKLSAPYRLPSVGSAQPESFIRLASRLLDANVNRIVWGSDWPHTQREKGKLAIEESAYRLLTSAFLAEQVLGWLPSTALRQKVLVDNPAKLYGFDLS